MSPYKYVNEVNFFALCGPGGENYAKEQRLPAHCFVTVILEGLPSSPAGSKV
jgi:hypothetical protein